MRRVLVLGLVPWFLFSMVERSGSRGSRFGMFGSLSFRLPPSLVLLVGIYIKLRMCRQPFCHNYSPRIRNFGQLSGSRACDYTWFCVGSRPCSFSCVGGGYFRLFCRVRILRWREDVFCISRCLLRLYLLRLCHLLSGHLLLLCCRRSDLGLHLCRACRQLWLRRNRRLLLF